jgi:acetolactate synthase-1/2/3 large subunit
MATKTIKEGIVAEAYLEILADRGVDYLFGNAGTDFAPIIEAFSRCRVKGTKVPEPITCPHENVAICMAQGYYAMTGRPQVVMVHVNVGTANAMCGLINAFKGNVPVLFSAGRTPYSETATLQGRRSAEIHWPQEMFDQRALVRELVKWDYELPNAEVVETAVDRALNAAMTHPRGPVYLTLPREPLAQEFTNFTYTSPSRRQYPSPPSPDADAIDQAAAMIAAAENPLLITASVGQDPEDVAPLAAMAERFAIPVSQRKPRYMCLPSDHPMHVGYNPDPLLDEADLIIVAECDVPWIPGTKGPKEDCKVIHLGTDPLFSTYPIRGYPSDLAITGLVKRSFAALDQALAEHEAAAKPRIDARRKRIAALRESQAERRAAALADAAKDTPIHPAWVTHCLDQARDDDAIIIRESQFNPLHANLKHPGSYFSLGQGGGLGWGLGTALGAKLASRERQVICTQGDGAYMFGNPVPAHYVSAAEDLPMLTVVFNNHMWNAVRRNTRDVFPDGAAAKSNWEPLTYFQEGTAYEKAVEVAGGYGERVEDPEDLPKAIDRALNIMAKEGRQALLNVVSKNG